MLGAGDQVVTRPLAEVVDGLFGQPQQRFVDGASIGRVIGPHAENGDSGRAVGIDPHMAVVIFVQILERSSKAQGIEPVKPRYVGPGIGADIGIAAIERGERIARQQETLRRRAFGGAVAERSGVEQQAERCRRRLVLPAHDEARF